MKVLFVTPFISNVGGGVAEVVKLTEAAVREYGFETEIWAFKTSEPSLAPSTRVRLFRCYPPKRFGFSPTLFLALLKSDADIIHVHGLWMFHVAAVYFAAFLTGKRYVVTPHGMLEPWILRRSVRLKAVVSRLFQNRFLGQAQSVQALTQREATDIERFLPGSRIKIIPNYVVPSISTVSGQPSWWDPRFADRRIYLFLARINAKKGYRELLDSWDRLCVEDAEFRETSALVFCGWLDGADDFNDLLEAVAERHHNVVYGGPQFDEEKSQSFAAAHFVVLPSYSEGLPMTVLEAWAAGKPVLMTDACNLSIGFSQNAALELHLDSGRLVEGLRAAAALSMQQRSDMCDNARRLVAENFSKDRVARALVDMYRSAKEKTY